LKGSDIMSEIREYTIEIRKVEEININALLENSTLEKMCDSLCQMVVDKLTKLSKILKACDIATVNNQLIVNDNLSVVTDFKNIAESFGLTCKEITKNTSGLKGKTYIIYDDIVDLIYNLKGTIDVESLMGNIIDFEQALKSKINNELLISNGGNKEINSLNSSLFQEIISAVRENKSIKKEIIEEVFVEEYNGSRTETSMGIKNSQHSKYIEAAKKLNDIIQEQNNFHKKSIVDGTKCLISTRAKQMGYRVEEKNNAGNIELVLVRL